MATVDSGWYPPTRVMPHMMLARWSALLAVVTASALLAWGCRTSLACTANAVPSFDVTVMNAAGKRLCAASVTARDRAFSAVLQVSPTFGGTRPCVYGGVTEPKGIYSIEVRDGTRTKTVNRVKVSADACHVHTRYVTVVLDQ
jgi:hypothetical protein